MIHTSMAGFVERGDIPGIVTLVARGDEVQVDAMGVQTVGGEQPMRRDTIFRIASITKPIAAAAIMILVDDGGTTCRTIFGRASSPASRSG
jgi:CubicO group peptidase (beta-lactamase class C family)